MKKYGGDPAKGERPDMRMCKWDGSGADSGLLFHVHPLLLEVTTDDNVANATP